VEIPISPTKTDSSRYYANSVLDSIHRGIAVDAWSKYQGNALSGRGLDRALGAFDMFVLHDQPEDLDYVCLYSRYLGPC